MVKVRYSIMLCSECSKPVVPVVAIDIDGTLGDYHGHFLKFAEDYLGKPRGFSGEQVDVTRIQSPKREYVAGLPLYDGSKGFKTWFLGHFHTSERTWNDIKLAYRQGGMKRSMPVYEFATELCRAVRSNGAELWLTTTRPYLRLDNVDPDTRFWLDRHGIEFDGLLYDEFKYARLAEYVDRYRVVAIVDDLPEMIEAASRYFDWRVPILRTNWYNRATVTEPTYDTLDAVAIEVTKRIETWKRNHDDASIHSDA